MSHPHTTDQELLNRIRHGDELALEGVYKAYRPVIQRYVLRHQGTVQDAQDLYQEVMLAFYQNVTEGRLETLTSRLSTYLVQVAQNQWRNRLRSRKRKPPTDSLGDTDPPDQPTNTAYEDAFLQAVIRRLDERCRQLLLLFYFDRLPMQTVAQRLSLTDGEAARKRKFDCLSKLKKLAQHHSEPDYDPA